MICPNCNQKIQDHVLICPHCSDHVAEHALEAEIAQTKKTLVSSIYDVFRSRVFLVVTIALTVTVLLNWLAFFVFINSDTVVRLDEYFGIDFVSNFCIAIGLVIYGLPSVFAAVSAIGAWILYASRNTPNSTCIRRLGWYPNFWKVLYIALPICVCILLFGAVEYGVGDGIDDNISDMLITLLVSILYGGATCIVAIPFARMFGKIAKHYKAYANAADHKPVRVTLSCRFPGMKIFGWSYAVGGLLVALFLSIFGGLLLTSLGVYLIANAAVLELLNHEYTISLTNLCTQERKLEQVRKNTLAVKTTH